MIRTPSISVPVRDRLAAPVVLFYWLLLAGGLGVYTAVRGDSVMLPSLWVGAVSGTAVGQLLALRGLRLWFAAISVGCGALVGVAAGIDDGTLWGALLPAAFCGYLSLGDRGALVAFWFPAVIWMLSVLEHVEVRAGQARLDGEGAVLLGGLALLFLGFLRAREERRIGLARSVASVRLSSEPRADVLREAPGRTVVQAAWSLAAGGSVFALVAWIAPTLWQHEEFSGSTRIGANAAGGAPCCEAQANRSRVREYLDLGRARDESREDIGCVRCDDLVAAAAPRDPSLDVVAPAGETFPANGPVVPQAPIAAVAPSHAVVRVAPTAPAALVASPPPVAPVASPAVAAAPDPTSRFPVRSGASDLLALLATLIGAALALQGARLAVRPLRRLVTLRHLRRPCWPETVHQRVSNLWQLALVGLRDAGWRPGAAEPPARFARRVGVEGVAACATILERARAGLGIDAGDLQTLETAAEQAYRGARRRASLLARAAAWLRWPLA